MSVFAATESAFHKHPALIIGGILGIVAIGYVYYHKSGTGTNAVGAVQYSLGPSDAAIQAGSAIQIAQIAANAASAQTTAKYASDNTIAGVNATAYMNASNNGVTEAQISSTVAQSQQEYGYLATQSNNALASHVSDNTIELGINKDNTSANVQIQQAMYGSTTAIAQAGDTAQVAINANNNKTAIQGAIVGTNAALAGSIQSEIQLNNQAYNNEIWSSVQSGQTTATLDALRQSMVNANTAAGLTSAQWQAFPI